jgi:MFS family permease
VDHDRDSGPVMRTSDRQLIYASAFVRAVAVGFVGVLAALHLAASGLDDAEVTWVIAAGLFGAAAAAAVVTVAGDRLGRRATLVGLALLSAAGAVGFALLPGPVPLAIAAFAGMVNGMGRDRGASLILEQAILPATTGDAGRTRAFAAYNIAQDVGHALGAVLAGLPALLRFAGANDLAASRAAVVVYAGLALVPALICLRRSAAVEPAELAPVHLEPASRARITRLAAVFGLDSLGGGFLAGALAGGDLAVALLVGAALKILYDILLYVSFRRIRPPEEASA